MLKAFLIIPANLGIISKDTAKIDVTTSNTTLFADTGLENKI